MSGIVETVVIFSKGSENSIIFLFLRIEHSEALLPYYI